MLPTARHLAGWRLYSSSCHSPGRRRTRLPILARDFHQPKGGIERTEASDESPARIGGNHLRGRIRASTFRLTLASALAIPLMLITDTEGNLDRVSERRLSAWMREHLHIAVHPFAERDALSDLEHRVLARLNPPLNLDGMSPPPLRAAVSEMRTKL